MREPGEHCCRKAGRPVVGIDEVGRGCIAGHVTAAAVWFPELRFPEGVRDSKTVPEGKRDAMAHAIRQTGVVAIGHASVFEIERHGILKATHIAMARAWLMLPAPGDALVIVDGSERPDGIDADILCVNKADATCPSVSAASVVAKVDRDQAMRVLAGDLDPYGWKSNKGYGTPAHLRALKEHGATIHHRASFDPVRQIIRQKAK